MKIRKATLQDLKEIDEIYVEGLIDEKMLQYPNKTKKEIIKDLSKKKENREKEFKRKMLSKRNYWIAAIEGGRVIGFGEACLKNYRNDLYYGEIEYLYIKKEFRGKKIGKKINLELIKWLKKNKIKTVGAWLYSGNNDSFKFHKKHGFKVTALRMEKKI